MRYKQAIFIALLLGLNNNVIAQTYNYSYGDSRVINQSQTGLYMPSGTYIGSGTLSQSAQGKNAGVGGALPTVNMGGHVRTPGDNLYSGNESLRTENGSFMYRDELDRQRKLQILQLRRKQAIINRQNQKNQQQVQQGNLYTPGQNQSGAATYADTQVQYNNQGAATYGK
jgi:hypothetical protein